MVIPKVPNIVDVRLVMEYFMLIEEKFNIYMFSFVLFKKKKKKASMPSLM